MSTAPARVRIRCYRPGFGDAYLLTFFYPGDDVRNILIDFGSTEASDRGPDTLLPIAEQIKADSGGKLHMVVASHRHADHISGFDGESGQIIASLKPELVVQPWTEDPDLDPEASEPKAADGARLTPRAFVSRLSDVHALAAAVVAEVPKLEASRSVPKTLATQIHFLGETNLKNAGAVRNLMTMGTANAYASFGTNLPVGRLLPGISIDVLGPPTLRQSSAVAKQRSVDPQEFWHFAALPGQGGFPATGKPSPVFPHAPTAKLIPQEARWLLPQIGRMRAEEMLAIVRILDSVLNNTSLILLLEIGQTRLLFPGDAQIENWSYALFTAPRRAEILERLADVRFYKVGHHGSLNATPKTLWNNFRRRGPAGTPDRLVTMVSTLSNKHGSEDRGTEVPRKPLIDELRLMSELHDTEDLRSKTEFWDDVELGL